MRHKAKLNGQGVLPLDTPSRTYRYHEAYLEIGRVMLQTTNQLILNPRDIYSTSLLTTDMDYFNDLSRYLAEFAYQEEQMRTEQGLS